MSNSELEDAELERCYRHNSPSCDCDDMGIRPDEGNEPDCHCGHAELQHSGPMPTPRPCCFCPCPDYFSDVGDMP